MVTVTFTWPSALLVEAGAVAFRLVLLVNTTLVPALAPNLTVAPVTKLLPVIVITVPPLGVATAGEIEVTVGAASLYVSPFVKVAV